MKSLSILALGALALTAFNVEAEIQVITVRNSDNDARSEFRFSRIPPPSKNDAATEATFTILAGRRDRNGGELGKLQDGLLPADSDYSEIDVVAEGSTPVAVTVVPRPEERIIETGDETYRLTLDLSETPDLVEWVEAELVPVVREWYPKLVKLLPSDGYEAPRQVSIVFSPDMQGVAAASGTRIRVAATWFRRNLDGEAKGAIVHELVHVVQQYGRARRSNPNRTRNPGWLVEGLADYIRWFLYEPESRGAEITRRNLERARHDASYRVTGNFLNWVAERHGGDLIVKLNAAMREGNYSEEIWKTETGFALAELGDTWKAEHEKRLATGSSADPAWRQLPLIAEERPDTNWVHMGWGGFVVDEGSLRTECDPRGLGLLVYTKERLGNCQIRVVYRSQETRSNAGVYVRIAEGILAQIGNPGAAFDRDASGRPSDASLDVMKVSAERGDGPWFAVHHGYEVQIADGADPWHRTGAIYSLARSSGPPATAAGEWRTMIITLDGDRIRVDLDGLRTTNFDPASTDLPPRTEWHEPKREPERPVQGYMGLQNHDPGDVVWFKEVSVRPLPTGNSQ